MTHSRTVQGLAEHLGGDLQGQGADQLLDATHDSRHVEPGWLYCCVPGANFDGHDFAADAVRSGAAALLVSRSLPVDIPQIVVPDVRAALGPAAAFVHGFPSRQLTVVGVTGTNGKSSIVQLLSDIWSQVGVRSELIGTLVGSRTTPEATDLQRTFRRAVDSKVEAIAMEVSSHALALGRVASTWFQLSIFTNLSRDHLDFHQSMEGYFEAKAQLFTAELSGAGVVNSDDEWGRKLLAAARDMQLHPFSVNDVDDLHFDGVTSQFRWRNHQVRLQLAGIHNVSNAIAAARAAELLGIDSADIADALCATSPVRGRFEVVEAGQPFHIAVDYAHTPDALQAALAAARNVAGEGRVLVVFGCGGDRDTEKRAEMGEVAERDADVVVLTSDNPRSEDPHKIIDDILGGVQKGDLVKVEPDRQRAIDLAVAEAEPGDLVLLAGKGHETYQVIGDETLDFDDREAALRSLEVIK